MKTLIEENSEQVNTDFMTALYFHPEVYTHNSEKLMGRHAVEASFVRGFLRHTQKQEVWALLDQGKFGAEFTKLVAQFRPNIKAHNLDKASIQRLATPGNLFISGSDLGKFANQRAYFGHTSWSVCGITHATASAGVMDGLCNIFTQPIQPWDALICTSRTVQKNVEKILQAQWTHLKQRLGATRYTLPRTPVIPLGIHCSDFQFDQATKKSARQKIDIAADAHVVLFMGRLSFHAKAHPLAMYQALQRAATKTGKPVVLIEAGWFPNEFIAQAFDRAAKQTCPDVRRIVLDVRKAEDSKTAWAAADIFCSLSDTIQETFGITPIEAMAAGLPVVVSDWDGYKDTVRDQIDGFRITTHMPQAGLGDDFALRHALEIDSYDMYCGYNSMHVAVDIDQCAQAFVTLINNPQQRQKMGKAAQARAQDTYDWAQIIPQYEALWAQLRKIRIQNIAETPVAKVPWPARMDPFHSFGHYATNTMSAGTKLALMDADIVTAKARHQAYLDLEMVNFASDVVVSFSESENCLNQLKDGPKEAGEMIYAFEKARYPFVVRHLCWLLKLGLIRVV